jgi:hypothetical protein
MVCQSIEKSYCQETLAVARWLLNIQLSYLCAVLAVLFYGYLSSSAVHGTLANITVVLPVQRSMRTFTQTVDCEIE